MKEYSQSQHIYRALWPKFYDKKNGSISPAAFIDEKGASVEVQEGRTDDEVCKNMWSYLKGRIASINEQVCYDKGMILIKDDSPNTYHRLLLDKEYENNQTMAISYYQALMLARNICKVFENKNGAC